MGTEPGLYDPSFLAAVIIFIPDNCIIVNSAKLMPQGHAGVTGLGSGLGQGVHGISTNIMMAVVANVVFQCTGRGQKGSRPL